jgi:hypothetical protein
MLGLLMPCEAHAGILFRRNHQESCPRVVTSVYAPQNCTCGDMVYGASVCPTPVFMSQQYTAPVAAPPVARMATDREILDEILKRLISNVPPEDRTSVIERLRQVTVPKGP